MIKVRIKKQAKAKAKTGYQVNGALANDIAPMGGSDYNKSISVPRLKDNRYITADPREESNIEAEGGEVVYGDINGDFFPESQIIKGPRHHKGGVPLNLPEDTFIFSDTRGMRIKDCEVLTMFGKPCGKKSYTPAELAKQYDINKYRVLLEDPDTNHIERKTAELMIKNYIVKLGCLALKQESMKGFPQGIPAVARPCMEAKGISEEQILPNKDLAVLKGHLEKKEEQSSQQEEGGNESMLNEAMGMNQGRPVAQPQQQPPQQIQPAPQPGMMQDGGGYSDVYRQEMQQQQSAQQEMMKIAQQVESALEGGAAPQQVVEALLHDQIPPETIAKIFTQLGAPQDEVVALIQQSMSAAQQQQPQQQPMAQDGMQVMDLGGEVTVKEADYDGDPAGFQEALRNAYADVGPGGKVYVQRKDGKRYLQNVSATGHSTYTGSDLAGGWNNNQVAAATFHAIKETYNKPLARKRIADQMRIAMAEKENYKRKGSGSGYNTMYDAKFHKNFDDYSDQELIDSYLKMQERNLKTTTLGSKIFDGLPARSNGKPYPYGSWMYKDGNGSLRIKEGSGNGDAKGFIDVVMEADPDLTRAEAVAMYNKVNTADYKTLTKVSHAVGLDMDHSSTANQEEAYIQQAGFIAANNLMKDLKANPGNYTKEERASLLGVTSFAGFDPYGKQIGYDDESGMGETNISPIDGWYTNTTQGEIQAHHDLKFADFNYDECQCDDPQAPNYSPHVDPVTKECTCDPPEATKKCPCVYPDGREINMTPDPQTGDCPPCEEPVDIPVPGGSAPWWLQDTIKTTGAFGDLMGIKKHMPWAPGVDLEEPRPTFLDPTRELAANAEQANIQTQGMAQFAGPQALSSRSSGIQGQAAKNAADVLAKYNNSNVNIANQFELKATDVRNQESMLRQATSQRVYDQNTVANQQFDNSKLALRNNLRNQYTNAITNRWKTDAMNQMYPDYAVDPSVGGQMHHTPNPKTPSPTSSAMTFQEAFEWCKNNGDSNPSACAQRMRASQKGVNSQPQMPPNMYPGFKKGGQVEAGYVYFNPWFNDDM